MKRLNRREVLGAVATTGVAALAGSAAAADPPAANRGKHNIGPAVPGTTRADSYGPKELFAVVDSEGNLRRGLHAVSSRQVEAGVYEVRFGRDVRRGVYVATAGGHGYEGMPPAAAVTVMGLASDPPGRLRFRHGHDRQPDGDRLPPAGGLPGGVRLTRRPLPEEKVSWQPAIRP
jgi:hypothetical protein